MEVAEMGSIMWSITGLIVIMAGVFTDNLLFFVIGILAFCLSNLIEINRKIKPNNKRR